MSKVIVFVINVFTPTITVTIWTLMQTIKRKQNHSFYYVIAAIGFFILQPKPVAAIEIIKINKGQSEIDTRTKYTYSILNKALEIGKPKFGDFKIQVTGFAIPNHQTLKELSKGEFINVAMAITTDEWERENTAIRVPIRRGIFSYRLLAINKSNLATFKKITTLEQLKKLTVGVRKSWALRKTLLALRFNMSDAYSYDSIFAMLDKNRFDYIPRGIHEIYDEIDIRKETLRNLMVEPKLALYIPSPFYIFVSRSTPQIAIRLQWGLEELVKQGILKETFEAHYGEYIKKADLTNRTIINVGNPLLPSTTPLKRKELWHSFAVKKSDNVHEKGNEP